MTDQLTLANPADPLDSLGASPTGYELPSRSGQHPILRRPVQRLHALAHPQLL